MRDKIAAAVFFTILATLGIFAPMKRAFVAAGFMVYENVGNTAEAEDGFAFIAAVDDVYINYLPFYNSVVGTCRAVQTAINMPVTSLLMNAAAVRTQKPEVSAAETSGAPNAETDDGQVKLSSWHATFINATDTHRNYLVELEFSDGTKDTFLDRTVAFSESKCERLLDESIEQLKRITSYRADDVNWYLYSGSRFQDIENLSDYIPSERSTYPDISKLFDAMPDNVRCDMLRFDTAADRLATIYRTDHHWNAVGADTGYRQILDMMRLDWPDIGEPREGETYYINTVRFNGSFSRFTNYYKIWDQLSFTDYHLPEYKTKGGGLKFEEAVDAYYNHTADSISYEAFYPYFSEVSYPENNTGHNLLIIGDSFARCISEVLASHFDKTWVIYPGAGVNIGHMIDKMGVTEILVLMYSDRLMYTIYNEIDWNRFVTE
jgi:hypothetical protein